MIIFTYNGKSPFPAKNHPVVALESTVITHGLPHPQNLALARDMERTVRENGAKPATIAVLEGNIRVGLTEAEIGTPGHL